MRTISMGQSVLIAVIKREIDRMLSRRIYFVACIVLPLFSLFFMGTIFGDGQMENLPIGVVDGDNTVTSRQIIRMVKVDPTFRVTQYYANETEARADVQKKNIYGYLSIPVGFEAKVMDGKEVALTYYYHYALLSVGSIIRKSKFPQNPKRSVRFSGKRTKRSVQKRKARNTQKAETKVL